MKHLQLDKITLDEQIRQRPLDPEYVELYASLMKEKVPFPPVEVVYDQGTHYLWDGFHRVAAAKSIGQKTILTNFESGPKRHAIWLSFSANRSNGLPRKKGTLKDIITKILQDEEWAQAPLRQIARHVGVSVEYVRQVQSASVKYLTDRQDHPGRVRVKRGTQEYEQKVDRKPRKLLNGAANKVPEELSEVFLQKKLIDGWINEIGKINNEVQNRIDNRENFLSLLKYSKFKADIKNLQNTLKAARPFALCPYCGGRGKGCKACKGVGFCNKLSYDAAPRELKK